MAKKVTQSTLNASTVDIVNVIRANADAEYQNLVPKIEKETDIPKVGEVIYGHPALANTFLNALVNRIALVRLNSATFNNPYEPLKKGLLEFGETIENIFVGIINAHVEDADKGEQRELKRTIPDVRSAFHVCNFRAVYPITVQDEDLYMAFQSIDGVTDLITKIVDSVYTSAAYDDFLLFKYLIIKGVNSGVIASEKVKVADPTAMTEAENKAFAKKFRGLSNKLQFMSDRYNNAGVKTSTPVSRQVIFMDSDFNASFDVDVLAQAFNMDKADFIGRLFKIDDFTTFDNDRFATLMAESDGLEKVTDAELANMKNVKAILLDEDWFQVYDNKRKMTEKYVASGMYWNYFYHVWETVSYSPFANAVAFIGETANSATLPDTVKIEITGKDVSESATVFTMDTTYDNNGALFGKNTAYEFVQSKSAIVAGIAVQKYGAYIIPASSEGANVIPGVKIGETLYYPAEAPDIDTVPGEATAYTINSTRNVGFTVTLTKKG